MVVGSVGCGAILQKSLMRAHTWDTFRYKPPQPTTTAQPTTTRGRIPDWSRRVSGGGCPSFSFTLWVSPSQVPTVQDAEGRPRLGQQGGGP